jgi:uncharacterized protein (TIGR02594 family)
MTHSIPGWLDTMRQITGTNAATDNATIVGWAAKIGELFPDMAPYCRGYTNDTIAWCGLTVGYCMAINGIRPVFGTVDVDRFLYALAWRDFGTKVETPQPGDVMVFDFGGGDHHVTLYEQTQGTAYVCRGGNQSSRVKVSNCAQSQCIGIFRPPEPKLQAVAAAPLAVQVFNGITATVFGGVADRETSAYDGHVINDSELGVALPARFTGPRPDVRVFNAGRSVVCKIVDVGPWNKNDPYWKTGARPAAESQPGTNKAGIDLTPAAARAIGIDGKGKVDWEFADQQQPQIKLPEISMPQQPNQAVLAAIIQQILAIAQQNAAAQGGAPSQTTQQPQNPTQQIIAILLASILKSQLGNAPATGGLGLGSATGGLGPVNGALGQWLGNLLDGKKSAIGIIGAMLTQVLQAAGPSLGGAWPQLGGAAFPVFLALAAWGVLGKLEKWKQPSS